MYFFSVNSKRWYHIRDKVAFLGFSRGGLNWGAVVLKWATPLYKVLGLFVKRRPLYLSNLARARLTSSTSAVPFWGQNIRIPCTFPPRRDCDTNRVKCILGSPKTGHRAPPRTCIDPSKSTFFSQPFLASRFKRA